MIDITTSGEGIDAKRARGTSASEKRRRCRAATHALRARRLARPGHFDKTYGDDAANETLSGKKKFHHDVTLKEIGFRKAGDQRRIREERGWMDSVQPDAETDRGRHSQAQGSSTRCA